MRYKLTLFDDENNAITDFALSYDKMSDCHEFDLSSKDEQLKLLNQIMTYVRNYEHYATSSPSTC